MSAVDPQTQDDIPQWFVIQPPVKAVPVPVLRNSVDASSVIAQLKADTVVQSLSQSAVWLCIALPKGERGFVSVKHTRPLTAEEQATLSTSLSASGAQNHPQMRKLDEGFLRTDARSRRLRKSSAGLFATLSIASCGLGVYLVQIEEQECVTFGFGGTSCQTIAHPYASVGEIFMIGAFVLLIAAVVAGIAWMSKPHK